MRIVPQYSTEFDKKRTWTCVTLSAIFSRANNADDKYSKSRIVLFIARCCGTRTSMEWCSQYPDGHDFQIFKYLVIGHVYTPKTKHGLRKQCRLCWKLEWTSALSDLEMGSWISEFCSPRIVLEHLAHFNSWISYLKLNSRRQSPNRNGLYIINYEFYWFTMA